MDSKIIDGRALALKKEADLREKISRLNRKKPPKVVDFCTYSQEGAEIYLSLKVKKAESLGIKFVLESVDNFTFEKLKEEISKENESPEITGLMMQVPLPENLYPYQKELIDLINPEKDVDGLKVNGPFPSATGQAVIDLLDSINIDYLTKVFVVVGSEGVEGSSIVNLLINRGAKVIEVDKRNRESSLGDIKQADVVISATGQKELISAEMVKDGVVAVDVGLGEFTEDVYEKASFYTPKYGGVGPMTIICLMENVVKAAGESS
jgi:methylenetetrahydrofolate dehydrogenase (NADP+) / methenyltetrahydrofolate cyclohydrolase